MRCKCAKTLEVEGCGVGRESAEEISEAEVRRLVDTFGWLGGGGGWRWKFGFTRRYRTECL